MEIKKEFIGLIGLGYWGKNILRNLHDLGVLHTACDSGPGIIAERKKGFPDLHFTLLLDEMLKNPDIKAVAISTPAAPHYEIVRQSLLAGKDVLIEKCQG
jgi:UDP-2-acetamido-3-amino-2,3-dideoxy-glucuronate N-acetyltransferase